MTTSPHDERAERLILIRSALVGATNVYSMDDALLHPVADALLLLWQRPVILVFRELAPGPMHRVAASWCTFEDTQYRAGLNQAIESAPGIGVCDGLEIAALEYSFGVDNTFHVTPSTQVLDDLRDLLLGGGFAESELGSQVVHAVRAAIAHAYVAGVPQNLDVGGTASEYSESSNDRARAEAARQEVIDAALEVVRHAPILGGHSARVGGEEPLLNLFFTAPTAYQRGVRRRGLFGYTAGLVLGTRQRLRLCSAHGAAVVSELETPLSSESRSIGDSVAASGVVDFSSEGYGEGRDQPAGAPDLARRNAEQVIYTAISGHARLFYVPVHVGGCSWLQAFTLTSSDNPAGWRRNFEIYRTLMPLVAGRVREVARRVYIRAAALGLLEAVRRDSRLLPSSTSAALTLMRHFPFPGVVAHETAVGLSRAIALSDDRVIYLRGIENPYFPQQIPYGRMMQADLLDAVGAEVQKAITAEQRGGALGTQALMRQLRHVALGQFPESYLVLADMALKEAKARGRTGRRDDSIISAEAHIAMAEKMIRVLKGAFDSTTGESTSVGHLFYLLFENRHRAAPTVTLVLSDADAARLVRGPEYYAVFMVVWNLWHNALNAAARAGASGRVELAGEVRGRDFTVKVTNSGMLRGDAERYLRGESGAADWGGEGLRTIMNLLRGNSDRRIEVESSPGDREAPQTILRVHFPGCLEAA